MAKIGVYPASGGLGTSIINHLAHLATPSELILVSRKPERLTEFAHSGATIRQADYDDPPTLDHAFDGVDVLMLISYASIEIEHRFEVGRDFLSVSKPRLTRRRFVGTQECYRCRPP